MKKFVLLASVFTFLFSSVAMAETKAVDKRAESTPAMAQEAPSGEEKAVTPKEAERPAALRKVLLDSLDALRFELATQSVTLEMQGDFIIEDKKSHLTVAAPAIKVLYSNGDTLDVGIIHMNMAPALLPNAWKVTVAFPKMIAQKNVKGEVKARLDIGKQKFTAEWDAAKKVFSLIKSEFESVQISFLTQKSVLHMDKVAIEKTVSGPTGLVQKPREIVGFGFSALVFMFSVMPEVATKGDYTIKIENGLLREIGYEVNFSGVMKMGSEQAFDMNVDIKQPVAADAALALLATDPIMAYRSKAITRTQSILRQIMVDPSKEPFGVKFEKGEVVLNNKPFYDPYPQKETKAKDLPNDGVKSVDGLPPPAPSEAPIVGAPQTPEVPKVP